MSPQLFVSTCTITCQAPLSVEFSIQEYWSGLPFPSPRDLTEYLVLVPLTFPYFAHLKIQGEQQFHFYINIFTSILTYHFYIKLSQSLHL